MFTQMEQHLQAIVTVLSLVNPLICGTMFAQVEAGQTRATRLADATKAALAVLVILVIAALAGARVLQVFGVSLDAFSIAGGGVLTWIGFSMLRGNSPPAQDPSKNSAAETVRRQPRHDYRSHYARCCACEVGAAGYGARRGRGSHGRNVGRYGACRTRRVPRKRRGRPSERHGDTVYGIDRHRYGRAVRADRLPQFFQLRT
jgi:MarC family integral membrane protein